MEMAERLLLALDGSTRVCSTALLRRGAPAAAAGAPGSYPGDGAWEVAARRIERDGRGQARVLLALVDEMLAEIGGRPADLGALVVGTGPGTFTGVRITVATARALSLALSVPVLGVSTLAALAAGGAVGLEEPPSLLVPVVDARRDQIFFGVYETTGKAAADQVGGVLGAPLWVRRNAFGVCDRGELATVLKGTAVVVAEDAALVGTLPDGAAFAEAEVQAEGLLLGQWFLDEPGEAPAGWRLLPWLSRALDSAEPSAERPGGVGTPESVKPIYVRPPDADIHITKMRDPWAADATRRDAQ